MTSLQARYGDTPATRRIVGNAERILDDVELGLTSAAAASPTPPYDAEFWRDVDDEGAGGHSRL